MQQDQWRQFGLLLKIGLLISLEGFRVFLLGEERLTPQKLSAAWRADRLER